MSYPFHLSVCSTHDHTLKVYNRYLSIFYRSFSVNHSQHTKIGDFAELFEGGFEGFDNLLGENFGIAEIIGFFEAFVSQPEDIEADFIVV
jgi:hypothetical protein